MNAPTYYISELLHAYVLYTHIHIKLEHLGEQGIHVHPVGLFVGVFVAP